METPIYKIIVTGPFSSGKTRFVQTAGEKTDRFLAKADARSQVGLDRGILFLEDAEIWLLATPSAKRFDFGWEIWQENTIGLVMMVDAAKSLTFREARSILDTFYAYCPYPFVVAANKQDHPDALPVTEVHEALQMPPDIPLLPCVARDKNSVKTVLLALCEEILKEEATAEI